MTQLPRMSNSSTVYVIHTSPTQDNTTRTCPCSERGWNPRPQCHRNSKCCKIGRRASLSWVKWSYYEGIM